MFKTNSSRNTLTSLSVRSRNVNHFLATNSSSDMNNTLFSPNLKYKKYRKTNQYELESNSNMISDDPDKWMFEKIHCKIS